MADKVTADDVIPTHVMDALAKMLDGLLQGRGFALVVFPTDPVRPVQYVSNVERKTMQGGLDAVLTKWRAE